jgi:hypothetical protein
MTQQTATAAPNASGAPAPQAQGAFRQGTQPTVLATGYNQTVTMTTATQNLPVWQLPTSNILRCIYLEVKGTTTSNAATVAFNTPDAPLNIFSTVNFIDNTGTSIVGSFDSYTLSVIQKFGGYDFSSDMRNSAVYSAQTGVASGSGGSFNMVFRIPVEVVARTGFGSLENTSSNSPLQLQLTLNSSTAIYTTAPTTLPTVTVTASLGGYWAGPPSNAPQAPKNFGTTQYWQRGTTTGLNGSMNMTLPNVGLSLMHRNWIFMNYATGGARSDTDFPNPLQVNFRGNILTQQSQNLWKDFMSHAYGYTNVTQDAANGLDTGVYVIPFNADFVLKPGADTGTGWLSTAIGDPVTLIGSWGGSSTLYNLNNFINIKGVAGSQSA